MVYVKRSENNFNREEIFWAGIKKVALVLVFQVLTLFGYSTVYYVSSSSGSDGNSGTSVGSAWRSLSKVNSFTPKPGDQILFKRGDEWAGTITVRGSGTSGSPIIYGAYGTGDKPKIYGSEKITGWTRHSGNIYKAKVTSDINQLFLGDKRVQNARYPKEGYFYIDKVNSSTSVTCNDLTGSIDYSGAKMHTRTVQWRLITSDVASSSSNTLKVKSSPSYGFSEGKAFFLNNHIKFLTQPGEWYYDTATRTVYLWTRNGDTPSNYEVRGSTIENCVSLENRNYVTIRDLSFVQSKGNALHSDICNYLTISNLSVENPGWHGLYVSNSRNVKVNKNTIRGAMSDGMYLSNGSIDWAGESVEITDNEIRDVAVFDEIGIDGLGLCNGIFVRIKNAVVKYNRIINNGYNGIQFYGQNTLIENNFVDGYCKTLNDGGGIYTWVGKSDNKPLSVNSNGSRILSNIVINGNDDGTGYRKVHDNQSGVRGIFTDLAVSGVLIENNTIARSSAQGIFYNQTVDVISRNNTLFDNPKGFRYTNNSYFSKINEFSGNIVCNTASTNDWYLNTPLPPNLITISPKSKDNITLNNNIYIDRQYTNVFSRLDTYEKLNFSEWQTVMRDEINSKFIGNSLAEGESEELFYNASKVSKIYNISSAKARDIYGNPITKSFTLKPFTSKIVIGSNLSEITDESNDSPDDVVDKPDDVVDIPDEVGDIPDGVFGNSEVYPGVTTAGNRRAIPVTFDESGDIESLSIYHNGGNGSMLLGVYSDDNGSPGTLLEKTSVAQVSSKEGWQTVFLANPVSVLSGQTVWLSWVFENNPGVRYTVGTPARAQSSETWSSGIPSSFGSVDFVNYTYSVYCSYSTGSPLESDVLGNTEVYPGVTTAGNRRALPVSFSESGNIESLSIYHNGGNGSMLLGVYSDDNGTPGTLLGKTSVTQVNSNEGWQTVFLANPVSVSSGQKVWLSWVFENSPGIRYTTGTPARAQSSDKWLAGMPATFGSADFVGYTYSVYCSFTKLGEFARNSLGNIKVFTGTTTADNRRAVPVTFSETGNIESISIYHNGGNGDMLLGVYSDQSGAPGTLLGLTSSTAVDSQEGWQTVLLRNPVPVNSGQKVWLSWVFENNPGIRYTIGTPARAQSSETWSAGLPSAFGSVDFVNYTYSVYCTYISNQPSLKGAEMPEIPSNDSVSETEDESLIDEVDTNNFLFYPNPAKSFITIDFPKLAETKTKISIIDSNGRIVIDKLVQSRSTRIDVNHLSPGLYLIKSVSREIPVTQKLIIQR